MRDTKFFSIQTEQMVLFSLSPWMRFWTMDVTSHNCRLIKYAYNAIHFKIRIRKQMRIHFSEINAFTTSHFERFRAMFNKQHYLYVLYFDWISIKCKHYLRRWVVNAFAQSSTHSRALGKRYQIPNIVKIEAQWTIDLVASHIDDSCMLGNYTAYNPYLALTFVYY